jgi:transaldolase
MGRLHDLYDEYGQSPWLDNLRRGWLASGELQWWIDRGVRGLTSNPSIFAKAMSDSSDYDDQLESLVRSGLDVTDAYWRLVVADINQALDLLAPVHERSGGEDGYVSVEVAPELAHDEAGTVEAARELHGTIDAPNLYVKVPATVEGVPAVQTLISEQHSINVTLIFSLERYKAVMDAYLSGLESVEGDLSHISSVASFFISRVDVEIDRRLDDIGTERALSLKGKAAVAQGKLAYQLFLDTFSGDRWTALSARNARFQRPLWASTSTKDPSYPDTLYVDNLIGPNTVNTLPDNTLAAFEEHGSVSRTVDLDVDGARQVVADLAELGIELEEVAATLETEGVASFAKSFDEALDTLGSRAADVN